MKNFATRFIGTNLISLDLLKIDFVFHELFQSEHNIISQLLKKKCHFAIDQNNLNRVFFSLCVDFLNIHVHLVFSFLRTTIMIILHAFFNFWGKGG